ncbi:hypothetical protein VL20_6457 [Microcystis panniformis FACHB-1757]|uniref:Uncharacterized protein n=1 Tax=Microcystis panniformis FACHB-1757 TaxID=1638788 RepID=A0A0K1SAV9_9CHRO|nr:hypothetical protein VL20_6457 [Microcystis panniformis FACHB-1757]
MIIFAYGTLKCLLGKTFRTILRIFYRYRPRFHTETRRAEFLDWSDRVYRSPKKWIIISGLSGISSSTIDKNL